MKTCKYCGNPREDEDFGITKTVGAKVYRRLRCSFCYREMKQAVRERKRVWLTQFRKSQKCSHCGFSDHRALVFHHRKRSTKEFSLGNLLHTDRSLENIKKEIKKCEVLCANCHSILHYDGV